MANEEVFHDFALFSFLAGFADGGANEKRAPRTRKKFPSAICVIIKGQKYVMFFIMYEFALVIVTMKLRQSRYEKSYICIFGHFCTCEIFLNETALFVSPPKTFFWLCEKRVSRTRKKFPSAICDIIVEKNLRVVIKRGKRAMFFIMYEFALVIVTMKL